MSERIRCDNPSYRSIAGKKASQRHSGKLAQPQNFEKLQILNNFFDISLDLEGLFGPPFYFLAD